MKTVMDRFWSKVDIAADGCWLWRGTILSTGYGQFCVRVPKRALAHRFAYEITIGPIPDGLQIDHLCRVRSCVNPTHLEPVTGRVNTLRGNTLPAANATKTHCIRGHEYTPENTYIYSTQWGTGRTCRICKAENDRTRSARQRSAA